MGQVSLIDGHIDDVRGDLISRSALIAEYDRVHIGAPGGARKLMKNAPAVDAVEVVRCKDCKYWSGYGGYCKHFGSPLGGTVHYPRMEDYCSHGERRDGE